MKLHPAVLLLTFVALVSWEGSQAQMRPANPTDLHAAYCIVVLQDFAGQAIRGVAESQPPKNEASEPPAVKEARDKSLAAAQSVLGALTASLRRIQRYLVPRVMHLDPTDLLAASTAAKADLARLWKTADECTKKCTATGDVLKCVNACTGERMPDLPGLQKKWKSCSEPDWLQ